MKPYRVKHIPTGLYYKPVGSTYNNLSKSGKIYWTKSNVLNTDIYERNGKRCIGIHIATDSPIHKRTQNIINWEKSYNTRKQIAWIPIEEFKIEEITIDD